MTTINGRACVVNGTPVDKVFSNDKQVYGRNLLLDTNFDNLPKYWTTMVGTVTGTFNGHNVVYYDARKSDYNVDALQQIIYDPALTTRVVPNQWYTLSFYAKGLGQMISYVYPNIVYDNNGGYADGVKYGYINNDGSNVWDLTDDWTRHTYTFKSKSSFPANEMQNVLFRVFKGNTVYIAMPQLEVGTLATPYSLAPEDVM